jgi:hypothetical protein
MMTRDDEEQLMGIKRRFFKDDAEEDGSDVIDVRTMHKNATALKKFMELVEQSYKKFAEDLRVSWQAIEKKAGAYVQQAQQNIAEKVANFERMVLSKFPNTFTQSRNVSTAEYQQIHTALKNRGSIKLAASPQLVHKGPDPLHRLYTDSNNQQVLTSFHQDGAVEFAYDALQGNTALLLKFIYMLQTSLGCGAATLSNDYPEEGLPKFLAAYRQHCLEYGKLTLDLTANPKFERIAQESEQLAPQLTPEVALRNEVVNFLHQQFQAASPEQQAAIAATWDDPNPESAAQKFRDELAPELEAKFGHVGKLPKPDVELEEAQQKEKTEAAQTLQQKQNEGLTPGVGTPVLTPTLTAQELQPDAQRTSVGSNNPAAVAPQPSPNENGRQEWMTQSRESSTEQNQTVATLVAQKTTVVKIPTPQPPAQVNKKENQEDKEENKQEKRQKFTTTETTTPSPFNTKLEYDARNK